MFLTELVLTESAKADLWVISSPLVWLDCHGTVTVPVGFITDLASIPHALDWIPFLDRTGASRRPAALHDAIYNLGRERGKDYADALLRAALLAEGMSAADAAAYYYGVHWFGSHAWFNDSHDALGMEGNFDTQENLKAFQDKGSTIYR